MTRNRKPHFILFFALFLFSCQQKTDVSTIEKPEMMRIVMKLDKQLSDGVKTSDSALLVNIYSDSAQYVQPKRPILTGKREIGQDWADFLRLKEHPIDLVLNIKDVRGTREVIYETGDGYTLLTDSTKCEFNYVNVWRLQNDKTYKLEIDTFN
jgi:ketosteroid isomerase-like protein